MEDQEDSSLQAMLARWLGKEIGVTDWFSISQRDADLFSAVIDDWDYMHNDPAWATPRFGGTVVHGNHIIGLLPKLMKEVAPFLPIIATEDASVLNYGYEKVRFTSTLRIGQRARDRVELLEMTEKRPGDLLCRYRHTIEKEEESKPFMVCESLSYYVTNYEEKWRAQ